MDTMTNLLVHLVMCPGAHSDNCEICRDCPSCKVPNCKRDLKKHTMRAYQNETFEHENKKQPFDVTFECTQVLRDIGVPAHIKGYAYLRQAIELAVRDRAYLDQITGLLYPAVASDFGTTPSRVERAIRHAVEVAWSRGDWNKLYKYFGHTIDANRGKPTNSEFIAQVSDILCLKMREESM